MIILLVGIILIIIGIFFLYKGSLRKSFYKKLADGKISEYKKTTGIVICDAYHVNDTSEPVKNVTPIVEYEVKGEKYETQNSLLKSDGEVPVGTKMCVWYKVSKPNIAILGSDIYNYYFKISLGIILVILGTLSTLLYIFL